MIRSFYQLLDFLGSVFALLSPVTIIHWLIEATQEKALLGFVEWLDPFFHPLNAIFEPLFRALFGMFAGITINPILATLHNIATMYGQYKLIPSELPYDITITSTGHVLPITQGLLGLVFTILFFVCSFGAQILRSLEQKLDISKQDSIQRRRIKQLQSEQQKKEHRAVSNKHIMVCVLCDFQQNATTAGYFEQLYARYHGFARDMTPDLMGFEFQNAEQALRFCIEAGQNVIKYYATLRPVDPQPPFRVGIHTHEKNDMADITLRHCRSLAKYAGENQAVLSESVKNMIDATKQSDAFPLSPIGAYYLEGIGAQDLYSLSMRKN